MSNVPFSLVSNGNEKNVTVFLPESPTPLVAHSSHPNFGMILAALDGDDASGLADLFDTGRTVAKRFARLSDRVTVAAGRLYLDGDECHNALTSRVLRFLDAGIDDWRPLIAFFEKVLANPSERSRDQLYTWVEKHDATIMPNGDILFYKGVKSDGNGGYVSLHSGPAIVDGVAMNGYVPNAVGSCVEIARSAVDDDPHSACSTGLHVGTYEYATGYSSSGVLLRVSVNPRDVVSVPHDCAAQKVRTCRYTVEEIITAKVTEPLFGDRDGYAYHVGQVLYDRDGDAVTVKERGRVRGQDAHEYYVTYENPIYGSMWRDECDLSDECDVE